MVNRKTEHKAQENIIRVRLLQVAISQGPSSEMLKFRQPAPKLAHWAFTVDKPAFSKMLTE